MARALANNGAAKVYILGRCLEILQAAAKEHDCIIPVQCEFTSKTDLQSVVDLVTQEVGHVNLVVANSGCVGPNLKFDPNHSIAEMRTTLSDRFQMQDMTDTLNVNVTAAFFTMTAFLGLLDEGNNRAVKGGWGKPLNEGSDVPSIKSQVVFTTSIFAFSGH